jgi:hypothetical protein
MAHRPASRFATLLFVVLLLLPLLPLSAQGEGFRFALLREQARPGEPLTAAITGEGLASPGDTGLRAILVVGGIRLAQAEFFPLAMDSGKPPCKAAVLGIPSTATPGPALVRIESPAAILGELPFNIEKRDFAAEEIPLNLANTKIRTVPDPQKTAESELMWTILSRTGRDIYTSSPFVPPVTSTRRTSLFGDRRVYVYSNGQRDTSIHAGVDYGVPKGTIVAACADGKVILARPRIVTGNSVVIEHLPGVYSLYYHLDIIAVSEGQTVKTGEMVGKSGATGLATGPHLHWEVRVSGENTDPDALVARSVIDKEAILSILEL